MTSDQRPRFPAAELPADAAGRKLLGIYEQRQEGRYLQRIRIPGGRLALEQWLAIADAAEQVGARDALHLTTRQCIEVHDLTAEAVPALQRRLAEAGLSTVGAAGDTVRNFTIDPESGLASGVPDLMPLARAMTAAVEALPGIWELPRKFKISLSASEAARMRPWMSDLGFIAGPDGTFTAVVAGSLGAKPATGMHFADDLTAEEAVALVVAAVRLHALEGDRTNRRTARLRHVRERVGDDAFREQLRQLFAEAASEPAPAIDPVQPHPAAGAAVRLGVPRGDVPLVVLRELVSALAVRGGDLRIGIEHDLYVWGADVAELPAEVRDWHANGRVVACPGTALCPKAAAPTYEAADALAPIAAAHPDLLFAISGCPNSCSHAAVADVGLIGRMVRVCDEREVRFVISTGGQLGTAPMLAKRVRDGVPQALLAEEVRTLLGK